jgi:rod shape determining protein RodA
MINLRMLKLSDPWLWASVGGLLLVGFFAIFSCTNSMQIKLGADPFLFIKRQFLSLFIGAIGLAVFTYIDYKKFKRLAPYLYLFMILILGIILFVGGSGGGAQRWLQLGPFSFQPSELSKIIMVICLAVFFTEHKKSNEFRDSSLLLLMVAVPFLLIFKQPDLGTAMVFFFILIGMLAASWFSPKLLVLLATPMISVLLRPALFVWIIYLLALALALFLTRASVMDWILILGINVIVGIALPFVWSMLKVYQQKRIIAFLNPGADPYGAGYHSLQSKVAIGSGGIFGKGYLRGSQTQLRFIPEQFSDFIFSGIGEELGFIGASLVLSLFSIFVWRCFVIATKSADLFGSLLASGIAVMTGFHVMANTGMAMGLLPVVGMPLPFVSFGGSSLLMNMVSLGILQSIYMRRKKILF